VNNITLVYWYGDDNLDPVTLIADGPSLVETIWVEHVLEKIRYGYTIEDTSGNWIVSPIRNVTIVDNDLPEFGPDGSPSEGMTGENVTLSISASDNIELVGLWVEYAFGDEGPVNISLEEGPDGNYSNTVDIPWDSLDALHYTFKCLDSSGNWNATPTTTVTVIDDLLPWFGTDATPSEATTGDPVLFVVDLYDNIGIGKAWVEYWYGNENHQTVDMTDGNGLTWTGDPIVRDTYLSIWYIIHIEDTWGNHNTTDVRRVLVVDDDGPYVIYDSSPVETTTGVEYGFSLEAEDNLNVETVYVTYRFGDGDPTTTDMQTTDADGNGNGTYKLLIQIPGGSTDLLHYNFTVVDATGNTNITALRTVLVLDVTSPVTLAGSDVVIDQHDEVVFSDAGSYDNVGLVSWTWTFADVDGAVSLDGTGPVHTFHEAGKYLVTLSVKDPSGNGASDTLEVTVRDVTKPVQRTTWPSPGGRGPSSTMAPNATRAVRTSSSPSGPRVCMT